MKCRLWRIGFLKRLSTLWKLLLKCGHQVSMHKMLEARSPSVEKPVKAGIGLLLLSLQTAMQVEFLTDKSERPLIGRRLWVDRMRRHALALDGVELNLK